MNFFWSSKDSQNIKKKKKNDASFLRVIACNSGTQMRVRDSNATRIFF